MKSALISLGSKSSLMIIKEMKKYFEVVDDINLKELEVDLGRGKLEALYQGKPLPKYDCIYAKGSFRYTALLQSITRALFTTCYMPIKPEAFTIGQDKLLTHLALQYYKIPMPETYLASSPKAAKKILEKVNYPITLKFPRGTQGKGVMFADSYASASSMLDALETLRQPFLIQEYVETGGVDIRAIVIGDKVAASMKRKAVFGEKRANIHAGGKGESCILDMHTKKIAIDTAKSIGAEICAVDILESVKGPQVIEANLSPGLQGITAATKTNVADKIAKFLYEKTKEFTEKDKEAGATKIFDDLNISTTEKNMQQIIANLDIRSNKILLPKVVNDIAKFSEKEDVVIKVNKGRVFIERM